MEHYVDSPSSISLFFLKMEQILKVFIQPAKYCVITQCPPYFCCFLEITSIFFVILLLHNIPRHKKSISKRTSHSLGNSTSNLLKYYDAITALTFSILINAIQHLFSHNHVFLPFYHLFLFPSKSPFNYVFVTQSHSSYYSYYIINSFSFVCRIHSKY